MPENIANKGRNPAASTQAVRDFAQQGAAYSKDLNEKSTAVAQEANETMQRTYSTVAKGAAEFNVQWIEMVRTNTNASLDFARQMMDVKSPSEFLELYTAHSRKQFETFSEQARDLTSLAQKVATESVQPLQAGVKSALSKVA